MTMKDFLTLISPAVQVLLTTLVTALVPIVAMYLRRYLLTLDVEAKRRLSAQEYYLARTIVGGLVRAAEQVYDEGQGKLKKKYVIARAEGMLSRYGLELDLDTLENLLEDLVLAETNRKEPQYHILPVAPPGTSQ